MGYLAWTVPISGFEAKYLVWSLCYFFYRKLSFLVNKLFQHFFYFFLIGKRLWTHMKPYTMSHHHLAYSDHTTPANIRFYRKLLFNMIKLEILSVCKPQNWTVQNSRFLVWFQFHPKQRYIVAFLIIQSQVNQMRAIKIFLFPKLNDRLFYIQFAVVLHQPYSIYCELLYWQASPS